MCRIVMNRKIALLIGINYFGTTHSLNGCINDILNMKKMLITKRGYSERDIIVLRDDSVNPKQRPTKNNIISSIYQVIAQCKKEPGLREVWIHYSGHGSNLADADGDEADSLDECIVPSDWEDNGVISDDVLQYYLRFIPSRVKCLCLFDSCHSGTVLDLQYTYEPGSGPETGTWVQKNNKILNNNIILLSGSRDDQLSNDIWLDDEQYMYYFKQPQFVGAMTASFLLTIDKFKYTLTLRDLVLGMRSFMTENSYLQTPQLSSSKQYDSSMYLSVDKNTPSFLS